MQPAFDPFKTDFSTRLIQSKSSDKSEDKENSTLLYGYVVFFEGLHLCGFRFCFSFFGGQAMSCLMPFGLPSIRFGDLVPKTRPPILQGTRPGLFVHLTPYESSPVYE